MNFEEALNIYENFPLSELGAMADRKRREMVADPEVVTWQIDRNVNTTNVCISGCRFCNFHCRPHETELAYVTSLEEYRRKIEETLRLGGDQLLLQGGLHPHLGIEYYEELFRTLKSEFPTIKLNALGAPEIAHIARLGGISYEEVLRRLMAAGLDSLPGAGAEILDDGVRKDISPNKPSTEEWIEVMKTARRLGLPASATMMYGHVETPRQRIEHLFKLRDVGRFTAFIPWIFHSAGTELERRGITTNFSPTEYLRIVAISRLVLDDIPNIQASWLTVGIQTAQMALHFGANDMGSIMIEENVVSSAGASNRLDASSMRQTILNAGFTPRLRDQQYKYRD